MDREKRRERERERARFLLGIARVGFFGVGALAGQVLIQNIWFSLHTRIWRREREKERERERER